MSSCDFVAGWIGGCAGIIVGHPLDTIKVYVQCFGTPFKSRYMFSVLGHPLQSRIILSVLEHPLDTMKAYVQCFGTNFRHNQGVLGHPVDTIKVNVQCFWTHF